MYGDDAVSRLSFFDEPGHFPYCSRLKQNVARQPPPKFLFDLHEQVYRLQGVAAEGKKIIIEADIIMAENLLPDLLQ